jgi:DHA1 family bicyclomycin/chloramphenicol resistance-like MFS transporter
MIAPTAGGYIVATWGWRVIFLVLLILGALITLMTVFFLPESYPADKNFSLKPLPILRNFLVGAAGTAVCCLYAGEALAFAGLFAYVSGIAIGLYGCVSRR